MPAGPTPRAALILTGQAGTATAKGPAELGQGEALLLLALSSLSDWSLELCWAPTKENRNREGSWHID